VTHDIKDALSTADKIAVMNKGNLLQFGDPQCIYHQPKDNYVAQLFGKFNILSAEFEDSLLKTNFGSINLQANPRNSSHLPAKKICFRPEQACIISQKDDALVGIVQSCAFCGDRWQLRLGAPNHPDESIFIDCQNNIQPSTGDQIHFKLLDFDHWET
jgi:iron(III) transport system ATP-binding protein